MLTPELAQQLKSVAYQLIAIATGEAPGGTEPAGAPPGMVAVQPTGPHGAGVVRFYPTPRPDLGEDRMGYARRCSYTKNPATGLYHFPPQAIGSIGLLSGYYPAEMPWPEFCDRIAHMDDWRTQEELDLEAARLAQWGEWATKVGG